MIPHSHALFNPKDSAITVNFPDMAALRAVWRSLGAEEASASPGCRLGIARRRMELLSVFPAWMLPEIIDALNQPEPKEAFA